MRKNDPKDAGAVFRSEDRFFRVNGEWFFGTREGNLGPFPSRAAAERELEAYVTGLELEQRAAAPKPKPGSVPNLDLSIWDNQPDSV